MLQQTQVDRVIPKYHAFLDKFPNFESLAHASKTDVLGMRSGLGYNSRALNLQKCAHAIIQQYQWILPKDIIILKTLPGIWPYTSAALCAFVYNMDVTVIDINIKRVLIYHFQLDPKISDKQLHELASSCIPIGKSKIRHNALMDYGSTVYTSKKTGITSPRQSTFQGSTRQVRGNLIKYLTQYHRISYTKAKHQFPHIDFDNIIKKMLKEEIIHLQDDTITL